MTRRTSRNHSDPRIATFTHRGNTVTMRLISPEVSPDGRHIRRDAPVIHEGGPLDGKSVIVRGWLVPSTFEVTGLGNLVIRFTLAASNPLTRVPLVIDAMEITNAGIWRPAWNTADIPHDKLEREAIALATVWIRRKPGPPFVGRVHIDAKMTPAKRKAAMRPLTRAYGTNEVIGLAAAITQYDLDKLRGKKPRGRAPWDSAEVLREVARHYSAAKSDPERTVPIEEYIGNLTFAPAGTVRRQITAARKRGYITGDDSKSKRKRRRKR